MRSLFAFRSDVKLRTSALALLLAGVMACTGCWVKASWINTALQDLPVLIQMAESISSIVSLTATSASGTPNPQQLAAIQEIGTVATNGLQAIQAMYQSYSSANATTVVQEIQAAGSALTNNLQQLLAAAQIKDPMLLSKITAAVNLIVSTVSLFIGLIPSLAKGAAKVKPVVPKPDDLRQRWAATVGTPILAR